MRLFLWVLILLGIIAIRELNCWYWTQNKIVSSLENIEELLISLIDQLSEDPDDEADEEEQQSLDNIRTIIDYD